jgi:hypothetical protein
MADDEKTPPPEPVYRMDVFDDLELPMPDLYPDHFRKDGEDGG